MVIPLGCETGEPMSVDPCSCDESLSLRAQLSVATSGSIAVRVVKTGGYWTIELWRAGVLVESYVGERSLAYALNRAGDWLSREHS